jgi:hypothetical protein
VFWTSFINYSDDCVCIEYLRVHFMFLSSGIARGGVWRWVGEGGRQRWLSPCKKCWKNEFHTYINNNTVWGMVAKWLRHWLASFDQTTCWRGFKSRPIWPDLTRFALFHVIPLCNRKAQASASYHLLDEKWVPAQAGKQAASPATAIHQSLFQNIRFIPCHCPCKRVWSTFCYIDGLWLCMHIAVFFPPLTSLFQYFTMFDSLSICQNAPKLISQDSNF